MIVMTSVKFFTRLNNLLGDIMKIFNLILIMVLANFTIADDHVSASSAAGSGLPEGGFSTFHVVAENPYEYIEALKAAPEALAAGGGDVVGYCMTMTGHDYPGEMFIWNAYSSLKDALSSSAGLSYNPYDAPKQLQNMRKILYTSAWKPLTPFELKPGFERVTRVMVKPENTQKFLQATEMVQAAINASGSEFEMGVFLPLGGGSKETTMMLRGIAPDGESFGSLYEEGYGGAAWGQAFLGMMALVDEIVRDSHEQCEILYTAE